jgi:uncharacterized membrane protein
MITRKSFILHPSSFILFFCAAAGAAMLYLFDDSCQQDGGLHFLFAKWAWKHPELFVGVWSRPLFTFLYAFPALISYRAARILTVLICLAIAWQTWRLAEDLKIERAPFAMALLWLQPSFVLFCADTMTEPLFALLFVIALRLHHRGYVKASMGVASLLILTRPEGFFLGILWGVWVLFEKWRQSHNGHFSSGINNLNLFQLLLLTTGSFIWWLAALIITRDPLFIKHNWPANWPVTGTVYGAAGLFAYPIRLPEIVGPLLLIPFGYGLMVLLKRRELWTTTSTFLLFFILHTILRAFGLLGSAGYPRYLVAISPAIAVMTLIGWNKIAKLFSHTSRALRVTCATIIIAMSAYLNFVYADGAEWSRDARAIAEVHSWFESHSQPITRFIWSEPYSSILFDRDPWENPNFARNRESDLKLLRESPSGTLAVWDEKVGPKWFGLKAGDFHEAGFRLSYSQSFTLKGYILDRSWFGYGGPREQVYYLFYKP